MITKNDILYTLSDAIQEHEGWGELQKDGTWKKTPSVINNNPGNIKDLGQPLFNTHDASNFGICSEPINGKQVQINDLAAKMNSGKFPTIRALITEYAPPSENNTEAYITAVVAFFHARNILITGTTTWDYIMAMPIEVVQITIDDIWGMAEWASIQASITKAAASITDFAFSTRYVNVPIPTDQFDLTASPVGNLLFLSPNFTKSVIGPLNEGQKINILIYALAKNGQAGGAEYGGCAISALNLTSSYSSMLFEGASFMDPDANVIFHELIHCLFTLTGLQDYLHAYQIAHAGYAANALADLVVVYKAIVAQYKNGVQVVQLAQQAVAIATTDKTPADEPIISRILDAAAATLKDWFN